MYTYCIDMKAALLNLQEVTYCIFLPSEACSQYSYRKNYFVLLSWKKRKKKRVSLLAISTCKMTYWCILFLGFVCVRVCGREAACSVPWHCFCTSLGLAYFIIFLFPSSHTRSSCPLPPSERCSCRRSNVWGGAGGELVHYFSAVCSFLYLFDALCSVVQVWGFGVELVRRRSCFQHCRMRDDNDKSVCIQHTCSVCSLHTHAAGPILSSYHRCGKHLPLGHSIHLLF